MRHLIALTRYELRCLLLSPVTYIASILFLALMGLLYLFILQGLSEVPQEDLPSTQFFQLFWIPTFFVVPLLTMKSLAEERRLGTLETLMSTPITPLEVVFSKFIASYVFYLLIWSLTLSFPLIVSSILPPMSFNYSGVDMASLMGSCVYIGVSGLLFISMGLFSSSLTRSQLVSGMLSFSLLFFVIVGVRFMGSTPVMDQAWFQWAKVPLDYLNTFKHLEDFSRGVIDSRPIFFYIGNTILFLGLTSIVVEAKS